jgi:thymidylate kinase
LFGTLPKLMKHRLIIFYGSSPGSGKSTLSSFLFAQLTSNGVAVQWMYEEDILHMEVFAQAVRDVQQGKAEMIGSLLSATQAFAEQCAASDRLYLTDSTVPYFDWLFAASYPSDVLWKFSHDLQQVLERLNPLLIYLDSDVAVSLQRAIAKRGEQWLANIIPFMNSWSCHRDRSVRDLDDVIDYFVRRNEQNLALLSAWRFDKYIIDTTANNWEAYKSALLKFLSVPEGPEKHWISADLLSKYVGTYEDRASVTKKILMVRLIDGALFVNAYWPSGCRLVPESDTCFRLEDTSRLIDFDCSDHGDVQGLIYTYGGSSDHYEKIN